MNIYDEVKELIENADEFDVEFSEYGNGVSEEWIKKAESRLKITLPNTYKWWLKNYGGGEICGEEIFSIYQLDFDTVVGGDIVYMYELNRKNNNFPENVMVICETDDEIFYFDLSKSDDDNEYTVYEYNSQKLYADNFLYFLKKRILDAQL